MMTRSQLIAAAGGVATFFAVVCNMATAPDIAAARTLSYAASIAAVIAIACGGYLVRKGTSWRYISIAMIGPGLFVLVDAGVRTFLFLTR
jgi:hypothetical protein